MSDEPVVIRNMADLVAHFEEIASRPYPPDGETVTREHRLMNPEEAIREFVRLYVASYLKVDPSDVEVEVRADGPDWTAHARVMSPIVPKMIEMSIVKRAKPE